MTLIQNSNFAWCISYVGQPVLGISGVGVGSCPVWTTHTLGHPSVLRQAQVGPAEEGQPAQPQSWCVEQLCYMCCCCLT